MKIGIIKKTLGSGFFTGYLPNAQGTFGSLVALIIYLIPGFENPTIMILTISFFSSIGIMIGNDFEKAYGKDPKQCTIDELVGTWISLLFIPKQILYIAMAFIIWRVLDILKPFPAKLVEKIKGGWGIMLDDILMGFYTFIIMHLLVYLIQ